MNKASVFSVAALVAFVLLAPFALRAQGQQAPSGAIVRVAVWKVKSGMGQQFEAGLKKHNEFHAKANDPVALETWAVLSGPDRGQVLRIVSRPNWTAYDTVGYDTSADAADTAANLTPYMEEGPIEWWQFLPDASHGPMNAGPSAMDEIIFFHLKVGASQEFSTLLKRITEAANKTNWSENYYSYRLANGGEGPTVALVLPRNKFADFEQPQVSFMAMLEKAFGRAEAETIDQRFDELLRGVRTEIIGYFDDLSYIPAKK